MLKKTNGSGLFKEKSKSEFRTILRNIINITMVIDENIDKEELAILKEILKVSRTKDLKSKESQIDFSKVESVEQLFYLFRMELRKLTDPELQELVIHFVVNVVEVDGELDENELELLELLEYEYSHLEYETIIQEIKPLKELMEIIKD